MKLALSMALVGALAAGTALAAADQSSPGQPSSMQGSSQGRTHHWNASDVKQIQGKLKQQGYDVGQVDGKLGKSTQQALRQFQEDKGIQATGRPDQQTLAALDVQPGGTQQGQVPAETPNNPPNANGPMQGSPDTSGMQNPGAPTQGGSQ